MRLVGVVGVVVVAVLGACTAAAARGTTAPRPVLALSNDPLLVQTDKGAVRGFWNGTVRVFRGIPFAAAPVGDLRWRAPQPAKAWKGELNATQFGATCVQPFRVVDGKVVGGWPSIQGVDKASDDCLFINVYSPAAANNLPVMLYIHAGEFLYGSSNDWENNDLLNPDVVMVTFNFRVGPLGFLASEALRKRDASNSTGNYGMMDQQAAMSWVQTNIEAFGGDSARVTIFGESSGGTSVAYHLVVPSSQDYFQRAIMESPGLTQTKPLSQALANARFVVGSLAFNGSASCHLSQTAYDRYPGLVGGPTLASVNGTNITELVMQAGAMCSQDSRCAGFTTVGSVPGAFPEGTSFSLQLKGTYAVFNFPSMPASTSWLKAPREDVDDWEVDCLLAAPVGALTALSTAVPFSDTVRTDTWAPAVDGTMLTAPIVELMATQIALGVDILLGSNRDEGTIFMELASSIQCNATLADFQQWSLRQFGETTGAKVPPLYMSLEQPVPECPSRHPPSPTQASGWDGHQAAMRSVGDSTVTCPVREFARHAAQECADHGCLVFLYSFDHQPIESVNYDRLETLGAFHGAELAFVFNDTFEIVSPAEHALAGVMNCHWTNFAFTGNPNTPSTATDSRTTCLSSVPDWPIYWWLADPLIAADKSIAFDITADGSALNITTQSRLRAEQCNLFATGGVAAR